MPFEDETFEIILPSGVIHHTLYPEKALSELARVLKPNGYLILLVYSRWAHVIPNLRRGLMAFFPGKSEDGTGRESRVGSDACMPFSAHSSQLPAVSFPLTRSEGRS